MRDLGTRKRRNWLVQVTKVLGALCEWCGENTGREAGSTHASRMK